LITQAPRGRRWTGLIYRKHRQRLGRHLRREYRREYSLELLPSPNSVLALAETLALRAAGRVIVGPWQSPAPPP
jgi:hypothetical protein